MATMRDIIDRAARKVRIAGSGEALDAEIAADALDALNGMLHEWALRGVDIGHFDLSFNDPFPLDDRFRDGVTYMLAERMSPDYNRPRTFDADDFFRAIQAAFMTIDTVSMPLALTEVPSKQSRDGSLSFDN